MTPHSPMESKMTEYLIDAGQRLYYSNMHRSSASIWAENQREMVLFALELLKDSPTTFTRNAKRLLNKCGWFTCEQIFNMQSLHKNKQKVWRILNTTDCHTIQAANTIYYRGLSTGLINLNQINTTP